MSREVVVIGTGSYAPENLIKASDIVEKFKDVSYPDGQGGKISGKDFLGAFIERTGYKTLRKLKDPKESTSTLCVKACKKALDNAGVKAEEIDLIILSTDSPDFISPPTSARIQHEIGAVNASFFDLNAACAGYTIALATAWNYLKGQEDLKYALVIGGYGMSRFSDPEDGLTEVMFSDGAGAFVLEAKESSPYGIRATKMLGKGQYWDYMGIYGGGTWKGFSQEVLDQKLHYVKLFKAFPPTLNAEIWPKLVLETIGKIGWNINEVDQIFFTQVNKWQINLACETLGFDPKKAHTIMERYGYTGSACIPMAVDDAVKQNLLKTGDKIVICTSGGGASYAAAALIWGK